MSEPNDVVITGLGIVSPIGIGREAFEQSLRDRKSGVGQITRFETKHLAVRIGAELKDFEPKLYVRPRKSLKVMSREIQTGVASATLAMEDAGLVGDQLDTDRFGVVYGNPMLYADLPELTDLYQSCSDENVFDFDRFGDQFAKQMMPLWMLKYLPNMTASHIGIANQARGANNSIIQGDCSSLLAMIEATCAIQRGIADVMLTGGSGDRMNVTAVMYRGDSNLSHRNNEPEKACRPFDADRDGMVIGEAATTIVLESRAHAEARGARILGTIRGYASVHAGSVTNGREQAKQNAIERSISGTLDKAKITADQIGHVNAHGLGDGSHDAIEARAIRKVLGDVPVTATKSFFGNVGAASGALELSASLVSDVVPPTLNYTTRDPACEVNVVTEPLTTESKFILKLNQNSTGQAASVLVHQEVA